MTNLSISLSYAAGFYTSTFESFVERAAALGFAGVQLIPDQRPNLYSQFDEGRIAALKKLIDQSRLYVSVHNVFYDINPTSPIDDVQRYSLEITRKVMSFGRALGACDFIVHPGYVYPGWASDPQQYAAYLLSAQRGIAAVMDHAKRIGVRVLFENGSYRLTSLKSRKSTPFHFGIDIAEMKQIIEFSNDKARICFDIGKANVSNVKLDDFVDVFGERIVQVQFSSLPLLDKFIELAHAKGLDMEKLDLVYEGRDQSLLKEISSRR